MEEYPKHVYHDDGRHQIVPSAEALKKLGAGWSGTVTDKHVAAIRRAAGTVSETPVTAPRT